MVERQDAKAVCVREKVQGLQQRFACLLNGRTRHRAGDINQVEHFDGYTLRRWKRGRKSSQKKVRLAGIGFRRKEKSGLGLRTLRLLHFQDEVLVRNRGAAG